MPGFCQGGAYFLGGQQALGTAGANDVVQARLDRALVFLADQGAVVGAFLVGKPAPGFVEVGGFANGTAGFLDEVVALPLPGAVAGGDEVLLGQPAADGVAVVVGEQVVQPPPTGRCGRGTAG